MPDPSRMYPTMADAAQDSAPESRTQPQDSVAARMYPSVAEEAPRRREATPERRMYPSAAEEQQRQPETEQRPQPARIDPADFADFDLPDGAAATFTELGIDRAGAERLAELEQQRAAQYWDRQLDAWHGEILSEPNADQMVQDALFVVQNFGDRDLAKQLGPYGNHPGLIRMLSRIRTQLERR